MVAVSTTSYDLLSTCNALLFLCCTIITHQYHSEWDGFHSAPKGMQRIKITSVLQQSPQRCTLRTILDVPCLPTWQPFIYTYAVNCMQWLQTYPVSVEEPWQCKLHKFRLLRFLKYVWFWAPSLVIIRGFLAAWARSLITTKWIGDLHFRKTH